MKFKVLSEDLNLRVEAAEIGQRGTIVVTINKESGASSSVYVPGAIIVGDMVK